MIRSYVVRALPLVALLWAGAIVLAVADGSTAAIAIGFFMIGLAAVLLTALFFYEVGRSEDRDRERDRASGRSRPRSPQSRSH